MSLRVGFILVLSVVIDGGRINFCNNGCIVLFFGLIIPSVL